MAKIAKFTLERPSVANAFDLETALSLKSAVAAAVKARATGFIITSSSPKVFCGGGDLSVYSKMKTKNQGVAYNKKIREILSSFSETPLFLVAAVEGRAVGGGCELALACDYIIASHAADFVFGQVRQGLTTGWGGGVRLLDRVLPGRALDWLLSGRAVCASEALKEGLVDKVVADGLTLQAAEEFLSQIAELTPELILAFKKSVYSRNLRTEANVFNGLWFSSQHREILREWLNGAS
jgi:enoyl-CoA hydratase